MAIHRDNREPIPISRSDKITPIRPDLIPKQSDPSQEQIDESITTFVSFVSELGGLTPEAINRMYIVRRPAAIDRRNELIKMGIPWPKKTRPPGT